MPARSTALAFAVALAACQPPPPPPPHLAHGPGTEGPLACPAPEACRPLDAEVRHRCDGRTTVSRRRCGPYVEVVMETDPTSFLYVREARYYELTGRLVGKTTFANEYSSTAREGVVPSCLASPRETVCALAPPPPGAPAGAP